jgi:hypothetical protein
MKVLVWGFFFACGGVAGFSLKTMLVGAIRATAKDLSDWHARLNDILAEKELSTLKSKAAILKEQIRSRMTKLETEIKAAL